MSLITSEEDPSGLSNTVASLEKQLRGMCEDLEALSDRVRAEDFDDVTDHCSGCRWHDWRL